jgi:hypothetical protein
MNLFVAFKQPDGTVELVTPPLDDVVLPGVTRDRYVASTSWLRADAAHGPACTRIAPPMNTFSVNCFSVTPALLPRL